MEEVLPVIFSVVLIYCLYQLIRNRVIFDIHSRWIKSGDPKWYKYDYNFMLDSNKHNWWGLKFPREKDYK